MFEIFSGTGGGKDVSAYRPIQQDDKFDSPFLYRAQQLSEASGQLFKHLKETICSKRPMDHRAFVCLSGFEKPELHMLLSLCGNKTLWKHVQFSIESLANHDEQGKAVLEICPELTRSYRTGRVSLMDFDGTAIKKRLNGETPPKTSAKPTTKSLRQILQEEECRRKSGISRYRTIKKKVKKGLGVLLATSLVYLYPTGFLDHGCNANTIYISEGGRDADKPQAYIACTFTSEGMEQLGAIDEPVAKDHFVLALAKLLLELELEREVIVGENDVDLVSGQRSLFVALRRLRDDLDEYLDDTDSFPHILDACLKIYDELCDMGSKKDGHKVRTALFTRVVHPLQQRDNPNANIVRHTLLHLSSISYPSHASLDRAVYRPTVSITETANELATEEILL